MIKVIALDENLECEVGKENLEVLLIGALDKNACLSFSILMRKKNNI